MYNRYIPQPDGSYRRNRVAEPRRQSPVQREISPKQETPPPAPSDDVKVQQTVQHRLNKKPPSRQEKSITSFLRQILPNDLDTGDLLVIILLLLMAGDCADDQNTAMLTLAMYLFM